MWFMNEEYSDSQQSTSTQSNSLEVPGKVVIEEEEQLPSQRPLGFIESRKIKASEIVNEFLTTGCKAIDQFLKGGIPCFGVTEIFGKAGCAKSQMCLQLALMAQLPTQVGGLGAAAVYVSTEGPFPSNRMAEIAESFKEKFKSHVKIDPMNCVILETARDSEDLNHLLKVKLPILMSKQEIRLVILDSVTAVYRGDYNMDEMSERSNDLRQTGAALHRLASNFNAAVVVVNQASSIGENETVPTLGLTWTNMVTTRLQLDKNTSERLLHVVHASHLPPRTLKIQLSSAGIVGVVFSGVVLRSAT